MQIVIDIPEEIIKDAKDSPNYYPTYHFKEIWRAIVNSIPLSKGHGDLKDADKLKHTFIKWSMAVQGNFTDADIARIICNSPTIIKADEADKE